MAPSGATGKRTAKACKAMKPFGISAETVKSALKRLLEVYEKNWMYIEEDNYRVLIEAIFEPVVLVPKTMDTVKIDFQIHDESEEEAEPLKKKARLRSQSRPSSPAGTSITCLSKYALEMQQMVEPDSGIIDIFEVHESEETKPIPLAVIHPAPPSSVYVRMILYLKAWWEETNCWL